VPICLFGDLSVSGGANLQGDRQALSNALTLTGHLARPRSQASGDTEDWGYLVAAAAGLIEDMPRIILKRVKIVGRDGGIRHYDAFLIGRARRNPATGQPEIVEHGNFFPTEMKGAKSKKTGSQKRLDDMVRKGAVTVLLPAKGKEAYFPATIRPEVIDLRIPLSDVPEAKLVEDMMTEFGRSGVPQQLQASMIKNLKEGLEIERKLRAAGFEKLASQISIGMALGILMISLEDVDGSNRGGA
jgi:hypothetical protein